VSRTERARTVLSDWRFWVVIAYAGIGATVVALWFAFGKIAHEEANRTASARAASATQVGQCFTSAKNGPVTKGFVLANLAVIDNSLIANRQALQAQPTSPLTTIRLRSLARLEDAKRKTEALSRLINKNVPTTEKCLAMAEALGVDASRYLHERKSQ
jgi:hypothetical protein